MRCRKKLGSLLVVSLFACSSDSGVPARVLTNTWDTFQIGAGQEDDSKCMSWTLDNDTELFINKVEMMAGPGWHHSNWFFVPETDPLGQGPDGIWDCDSRGFNVLTAAVAGGVLFAQSTQVTSEVQQFKPGVAIPIGPRSRIVGQIHLLNTTNSPLDTSMSFTLNSIAERDVVVRLAPLAFFFQTLAIPPNTMSEFTTSCDLRSAHESGTGRPIDFSMYYVLPHYHALGQGMRVQTFDQNGAVDTIYESMTNIGEPLGAPIDPEFDLTGSDGVRFSCFYNNSRNTTIGWGIGDQEMCIFLGFTDAEVGFIGGVVNGAPQDVGVVNGYQRFEGNCGFVLGVPR